MLAYSVQDLILEPFAGLVFGMTPGATTKLSGLQNGGVLAGMLLVAGAAWASAARVLGSLKLWTVAGCLGSALALVGHRRRGLSGPPCRSRQRSSALGLCQRHLRGRGHRLDDGAGRRRRRGGARHRAWASGARRRPSPSASAASSARSPSTRSPRHAARRSDRLWRVFALEALLFVVAAAHRPAHRVAPPRRRPPPG